MADRIETQLIVKAIAEGFDKVSKEQEKITDEAKKQPGILKKVGESWLAVGAAVGGAFVALQGLKKVWDFAQEGAQVRQTAQSFDFLIDKLGASRTLLGELKTAAGGTVDDMTLMSSTATLLAGVSDDLGRALANSTPQLLEIAKAANKLNPSLGDTAHQYESIATGIKRASPLILDNLGLTVKVGAANEAYAEQIGKTVAELTAEDRQMALLNATLEAGDKLIAQVGGSTEALGDDFQRLAAAQKNAWDRLKAGISEALEPAAAVMADMVEQSNQLQDALSILGKDVEFVTDGMITFTDGTRMSIDEIIKAAEGVEGMAAAYEAYESRISGASAATDDFTGALEEVPDDKEITVSLSLPQDIERQIEEMLVEQKGGLQVQGVVDQLFGPAGENLTAGEKIQLAEQLQIAGLAVQFDAETIDASQVKQALIDDLGMTSGEAAEVFEEIVSEGEVAARSIAGEVQDRILEAGKEVSENEDFQTMLSGPQKDAQSIRRDIAAIPERKTVTITVRTVGGPIPGRQHGGPLEPMTLVGERGPEMIIGDTVVDAATTRRLLDLGIMPNQQMAVIGGGGSGSGGSLPGGSSGGSSSKSGKSLTVRDTDKADKGGKSGGSKTTSSGGSSGGGDSGGSGGGGATVEETIQVVEQTVSQTVAATVKPLLEAQLSQLRNQSLRQERKQDEANDILRQINVGVGRLLTGSEARVAFREGAQSVRSER